ncbi:unnamed protein product [Adineta steineri]|uniref:Peptidoglycan recognition protein family domain-containing protein n=1 Tax=Adineta steineri TaxID=433720 RepID=A0A813M7R0_9BILA|nr:unnamed protein product [Adineta steineri]
MLFLLAIVALLATRIVGDSCQSYNHPTYGKTGKCIKTSNCPNSLYISNLCESQPADVKCCFSSDTSTGTGSCPTIVSRASWGARAAKSKTNMATPVSHVVIHHTTGATCTTKASCITKMKGFQNYHMDSNAWADIGYNFLVGEDALSWYEKALEIQGKTLPENHPHLAGSYSNLGNLYYNMAEYSKALSYFERALDIWQRALPPTHPQLNIVKESIEIVKTKL